MLDGMSTEGRAGKLPNGFERGQLAAAITPRIQELIILPTEKCNFRCTYCYEDFELGKMSKQVQDSILRYVERRVPDLEKLRFTWFGGEPLVAKDIVLRLNRFARSLAMSNGIHFDNGITTNGYLLNSELAKDLFESGTNFFQITLDGWGETHDILRRRADGAATFKTIWANISALKAQPYQFECLVRVHVRRDNIENLHLLMRNFAAQFGGDPRFTLDFQHLRDMGGEGGKTIINGVTKEELGEIRKSLLATLRSSLVTSSVSAKPATKYEHLEGELDEASESASGQRLSERKAGLPYICYAAKPNSLLIRSNGRLGKCTVAFRDDENDLGRLNPDGTIEVSDQKFSAWVRGLGSLDKLEAGCPWANIKKSPQLLSQLKGIPISVV